MEPIKKYANQQVDGLFLMALTEGGCQVGELAKYLFCEDPIRKETEYAGECGVD